MATSSARQLQVLKELRVMFSALGIAHVKGKAGLRTARREGLLKPGSRFSNYLPNREAAVRALAELRKWASEEATLDEKEVSDEQKDIEFPLEFSGEATARRRYRYTPREKWRRFGVIWGAGLGLWEDALPLEYAQKITDIVSSLSLMRVRRGETLRNILKKLSTVAKKFQRYAFPELGPHWKHLVNIENNGPYIEAPDFDGAVEGLEAWMAGSIEHKSWGEGGMSEKTFYDDFAAGMKKFLAAGTNTDYANSNALTIEEFAENPDLWKGGGSSSIRSEVYYVGKNGTTYKAQKSKSTTALMLTKEEVISILRETDDSKLHASYSAVGKPEKGKYRWVVSADVIGYLRMKYVFLWVNQAMAKNPLSSLYQKGEQFQTMWEGIVDRAVDIDIVKVPIDQEKFDHHLDKPMIGIYCDEVADKIRIGASARVKDDLLLVLSSIRKALVVLPAFTRLSGKQFKRPDALIPVMMGLMSGLEITSGFGAACSIAINFAAEALLKRLGFVDPVETRLGEGDDIDSTSSSYGKAVAMMVAYLLMNFTVKPEKSFLSSDSDEYLRQVAQRADPTPELPQPVTLSGYYPRGISTILMRGPLTMDPEKGVLRARQSLGAWNTLLSRGAEPTRVWVHLIRDIAGGCGITEEEAERVIMTPATIGGLGFVGHFYSTTKPYLGLSEGRVIVEKKLKTHLVGLDAMAVSLESMGLVFDRSALDAQYASELSMPKADKEIVPGVLEEPIFVPQYKWKLLQMQQGPPTSARPRKEISSGKSQFIVSTKLEEWRNTKGVANKEAVLEWIHNNWMEPTMVPFSRGLLRKASRRIWIDWLQDKMSWKKPVVQGWSDTLTSLVYDRLLNSGWAQLVSREKIRHDALLSLALAVELETARIVTQEKHHYGN